MKNASKARRHGIDPSPIDIPALCREYRCTYAELRTILGPDPDRADPDRIREYFDKKEETRMSGIQGGLSQARIANLIQFVDAHLGKGLQVPQMAAQVSLSAFHFSRAFAASFGTPPHRYLTARRIEEAKRLLATTDTPIAEIARRVGYRTQAHFTGVFKQNTQTTPGTYRKQHRETASREAPVSATC